MGKDDFFDLDLGLGGSVVDKLTDSLRKHAGSNYHIITDNFFTSSQLLHSGIKRDCCNRYSSIE